MSTPKKSAKTSPLKSRRIVNELSKPSPQTPKSPTVVNSIQRRVSDILVSLHKCIQQWELDNSASFNTANTLSNLYNQWTPIEDDNELQDIISDECKRKYHMKLIQTREDLIKQLIKHKEKLKELMSKMSRLVDNLKAIYYLGLEANRIKAEISAQSNGESSKVYEEPVIFNCWTAQQFYTTALSLVSMYSKDFQLKQKLYDLFLNYRVTDKSAEQDATVLNKCVSIWLHQPYIESSGKKYLESMLLEADLK